MDDKQYQALKFGQGVVELANWSSVTLAGADQQKFLQNFCTNDVKRLTPGQSCEAFFLNVKGKIVGHGLVTCRDEELVIIGAPRQAESLTSHLERYVIREDVQLRDSTTECSYLLSAVTIDLSTISFAWDLIGNAATRVFEIGPDELSSLYPAIASRGLQLVQPAVFEAARIESSFPLFGVEFKDTNLPQEIGRDRQAISFVKGCYLGQETVARIDALGHVNQRIVQVRFSGDAIPQAGVELIHAGNVVGHVTSAAWSPKFAAPLALAMVHREANASGRRLESAAGDCEVIV